jgi:hypothetical protein
VQQVLRNRLMCSAKASSVSSHNNSKLEQKTSKAKIFHLMLQRFKASFVLQKYFPCQVMTCKSFSLEGFSRSFDQLEKFTSSGKMFSFWSRIVVL